VAFFSGFLITLPVIFWQMWLFVAPGLYENEKKFIFSDCDRSDACRMR